mgnify:CR=1 FL=1
MSASLSVCVYCGSRSGVRPVYTQAARELGRSIGEAMEEAGAAIAIDALLAIYSIPRISQVQLIYRATLAAPASLLTPAAALSEAMFF